MRVGGPWVCTVVVLGLAAWGVGGIMAEETEGMGQNELASEISPYLRQHADNPVHWHPWGDEAFALAAKQDRPVFLSIGYSTCHWCHVMEHESFEDPEVAALMNNTFVNIKVDREERPDIDQVYMTVCQMMTGSGGWPLTIIMTPDRKPFYAATYIPKEARYGRVGMLELIPQINEAWSSRRGEVLDAANRVTSVLVNSSKLEAGALPGSEVLDAAFRQLQARYDRTFGGFGQGTKFPTPHNLGFLLRYWKRTGEAEALKMAEGTLTAMRLGGIYDHVGFGIHRYSTDPEWRAPHFEKMLYDQALVTVAYLEAFQATGDSLYARTAEEILTYVLRDLTSAEGAFYSAEDADSEGREGKFYLWTLDELKTVLGEEDAAFAATVFGANAAGNFSDPHDRSLSSNVLRRMHPDARAAAELGLSEPEFDARMSAVRTRLASARNQRVRPALDDKILTDWNGLMIAALARAAVVLDRPEYAASARRAASFLRDNLRTDDGRLLHRYGRGKAGIAATLDDYAFLCWGLLELFEATGDPAHLAEALDLAEIMVAQFRDGDTGALYLSANDGEELLVRPREAYDGALPSGNSVAAICLLKLSRITGSPGYFADGSEIMAAFAGQLESSPSAHTFMLGALDFALGPSFEVVVAGAGNGDDSRPLVRALAGVWVPGKVVIVRSSGEKLKGLLDIVPFLKNQPPREGKATAYVCRDYSCKRPTHDPAKMLEQLGAAAP